MTSTHTLEAPTDAVHLFGTPRLLAGVIDHPQVSLAEHRRLHGEVPNRRQPWLVKALNEVGMLGRGGAAFPVAVKLNAVSAGRRTEVVINGGEGEPASHKDRTLMTAAPHLVLDGALVVAHALKTRRITIVVHDPVAARALEHAVVERDDAAHVGIVHTRHGFVGSEVRAVIAGLNGGPALPPGRRVLPHVSGVAGHPTFASNVETFAQIAVLASLGAAEYSRVGAAREPGTTLLTIVGDAAYPGVCEVPLGVPLSALLPRTHGPVLIGGYHGAWVDTVESLPLDRAALAARGLSLGAGVIARPPEGSCAVADVVKVARWLASESTGQCGPCWFGLPAIAADLEDLAYGGGGARLAAISNRLGSVSGRGACAHPDGAVRFIASALEVMQDDFAAHAEHGTCGRPHVPFLPVPVTSR